MRLRSLEFLPCRLVTCLEKPCISEFLNFISSIIDQCGHRRRPDDACGLAFFCLPGAGTVGEGPVAWRVIASSIASLFCLGVPLLLFRRTMLGKISGCLAIAGCGIAAFPYFATEPQIALLGGVAIIQSSYFLREFRVRQHPSFFNSPHDRSLQRARGALWTVPLIALSGFFLDPAGHVIGEGAIAASMLISQGMVAHWAGRLQKGAGTRIAWLILPLAASLGGLSALFIGQAKLAALSISLLTLVILPRRDARLLSIMNTGGNFSSITRRVFSSVPFSAYACWAPCCFSFPGQRPKGTSLLSTQRSLR